MKSQQQITSLPEALVYMTECTLATVSHMAMLKSKSKSEFKRQISIAQAGCDWIKSFGCPIQNSIRVKQISEKYN